MLIDRDQYTQAYDEIVSNAANKGTSILIMVGNTSVDSLCAARILMNILHTDGLRYTLAPVSSYNDIKQIYDTQVVDNDEIMSVILINCGVTRSLIEVLELYDTETNVIKEFAYTFYIIDYHRPLELENVWHDHDLNLEEAKIKVLIYDPSETNVTDPNTGKQTYPTVEPPADEEEEDEVALDDNGEPIMEYDEDGLPRPVKRRRGGFDGDRFLRQQHARQQWQQQFTLHYTGTWYSISSALILSELAHELGKHDNETVWCAILGITDMWLNHRMNEMAYLELIQDLRGKVSDLNLAEDSQVASDERAKHHIKSGRIEFSEELRLALLRHWSLKESIKHTAYTACKLRSWSEQGKDKLSTLLANMGVTLEDAKKKYSTVTMDERAEIQNRLPDAVQRLLQLTDMKYPSFTRQYGDGWVISASDMVYALESILECYDDKNVLPRTVKYEGMAEWQINFNRALEATAKHQRRSLEPALKLAISAHEAVLLEASNILTRRNTINKRRLRTAVVDGTSSNIGRFIQPIALRRLTEMIRDSFSDISDRKNVPTLMAALNGSENGNTSSSSDSLHTYLVLGIPERAKGLIRHKNNFADVYGRAAEATESRTYDTDFDDSVIHIHSDDWQKFHEWIVAEHDATGEEMEE